jgi:hypothetical protein
MEAVSVPLHTKSIRNAKFCISDTFKNKTKGKYSQPFGRKGISEFLQGLMTSGSTDIFIIPWHDSFCRSIKNNEPGLFMLETPLYQLFSA